MFKRIKFYLLPVAMMTVLSLTQLVSASAEPVAVIVNSSNDIPALSVSSIKKVYNNDILRWPNGVPILIYDLGIDNPHRELFSSRILGRRPEKIAELWAHRKITNQALNPPVTIKHQKLILRRVALNEGAIGYVSLSLASDNPDVRIVFIIQ